MEKEKKPCVKHYQAYVLRQKNMAFMKKIYFECCRSGAYDARGTSPYNRKLPLSKEQKNICRKAIDLLPTYKSLLSKATENYENCLGKLNEEPITPKVIHNSCCI